jgi:hypothetical protein
LVKVHLSSKQENAGSIPVTGPGSTSRRSPRMAQGIAQQGVQKGWHPKVHRSVGAGAGTPTSLDVIGSTTDSESVSPGSNPGRGATSLWFSRLERLPDKKEIVGSSPTSDTHADVVYRKDPWFSARMARVRIPSSVPLGHVDYRKVDSLSRSKARVRIPSWLRMGDSAHGCKPVSKAGPSGKGEGSIPLSSAKST